MTIDELIARWAAGFGKGFSFDGKGYLVRSAATELRLATKARDFDAKAYDEKSKLYLGGTANAREVDRMNEIVEPAGLIDGAYRKNPILLRQHCHDHPVGVVTMLKPEQDGLKFEAWCGDPASGPLTPMQAETRSLIAQRILRAVSIGFIPHKIRAPAYDERGDLVDPPVIEQWEMLELSVVSVPCNAGAIFEAKRFKAEVKPTEVQSLIFSKERFTKAEAVKWAKDHDFKANSVDETEDSWRLRQADPDEFEDGSFRTIELTDGIKAVIGKRKEGKSINFPRLGKDGKFISIPQERKTMDEVKELLKGIGASMSDLAKGINTLADGQKELLTGIQTLGKKPKEDKPKPEDDEDMEKRMKTLEAKVSEQGEEIKGLVSVAENLNKSLEALANANR
jgi:phage head maturation protease